MNKQIKIEQAVGVIVLLAIILGIGFWYGTGHVTAPEKNLNPIQPQVSTETKTNIANPASVYCEQNGGKLEMQTATDGGQTGICTLSDGTKCEEWAFMRGECKNNSAVDTANWKTYKNEKYGFEFQFPQDFYTIDNTPESIKMCEMNSKINDGDSSSDASIKESCLSYMNNFVVIINNMNAFCSKGGCIGHDLKKVYPKNQMAIFLTKTTEKEKNTIKSGWNEFDITRKSLNVFDIYYLEPKIGMDVFPEMYVFFSNNKGEFLFNIGSEVGTEHEEMKILDQILSTLKFY